jgi:predicted alpha/beta-hydrolase family hydrolase
MAASRSWQVRVDGDETAAVYDPSPSGREDTIFVCAHGAGGHMNDRSVLALSEELGGRGVGCVRFNFLYRARKKSAPDPMPKLLACLEAVMTKVRAELNPRTLIIGGRSMGGRAASVLASEGGRCDRLLLLAYPLHPPGQPEKLRDAHLPAIRVPVLCINGTRDTFCDPVLMKQVLTRVGNNFRMHWLKGADHGFHVLKSSGRSDRDVLNESGAAVQDWLTSRSLAGD